MHGVVLEQVDEVVNLLTGVVDGHDLCPVCVFLEAGAEDETSDSPEAVYTYSCVLHRS